jgi:hypothetical protein
MLHIHFTVCVYILVTTVAHAPAQQTPANTVNHSSYSLSCASTSAYMGVQFASEADHVHALQVIRYLGETQGLKVLVEPHVFEDHIITKHRDLTSYVCTFSEEQQSRQVIDNCASISTMNSKVQPQLLLIRDSTA